MARYLGWERGRIDDRLGELAELTRFPADGLDRFPGELSGGQRQRVSLMRALMLDPKVILLDEPLGALDPMVRAELQADLRRSSGRSEKTVVMVTHDLAEAGWFGDEILLMREGRIVQRGTLKELLDRPAEPFVTQFVSAQRQVLAVRARGRVVMPDLVLLLAAVARGRANGADGPGRLEGVHRIGDPGRDRAGSDSRRGRHGACIAASWAGPRSSSTPSRPTSSTFTPSTPARSPARSLPGKGIRDEDGLCARPWRRAASG